MNMSELRAKYPNPVASSFGGGYCVGGALCQGVYAEHTMRYRFPTFRFLLATIHRVWPRISPLDARAAATAVISENGDMRFNAAWRVLEDLEYGEGHHAV